MSVSSVGGSLGGLRIRFPRVPDCPLTGRLRTDVERAVATLGLSAPVVAIAGPYPSPTLLIDNRDVIGQPCDFAPSCRPDLPTTDEIVAGPWPPATAWTS